jgi:hypothetical protein
LAVNLLTGLAPYRAPDFGQLAQTAGITDIDRLPHFYLDLFYQGDIEEASRETLLKQWKQLRSVATRGPDELAREFIRELVKLPEFELV